MKPLLVTFSMIVAMASANAAELAHQFNSPAFSGVGYSSHVLTLKQLEDQQKDKNKAAADALKAAAEREAANTPQARFQASMETRVYSELAKRISDSLFGSSTTAPSCTPTNGLCGDIDLAGQNITWRISGTNIIVRIEEIGNPKNFTEMIMPYAAFKI